MLRLVTRRFEHIYTSNLDSDIKAYLLTAYDLKTVFLKVPNRFSIKYSVKVQLCRSIVPRKNGHKKRLLSRSINAPKFWSNCFHGGPHIPTFSSNSNISLYMLRLPKLFGCKFFVGK